MIATVFIGDPDGRADYFLDHAPRSTVKGDYVTALDLRICWSGGNSLFGFALVAYAVLVVLAAPRDIIRAPVDGRFGFLSHESIIPHPTLNARPVCVYYNFFFFYFLFFSLDT